MISTKFQNAQLIECLLSPQVQVQLPAESEEVPAKLKPAEVAKVFTDHVPGVGNFLFRQQRGQYVLKFIQIAYKDGWTAFQATPLHNHLKWLMRLIVHYGHEGKPGAAAYLTEVAEAFMDCQAVQARVVERVGLQIRGVTTNFRGLVMALVGEYKTMALKMLAAERIMQGKAHDDATPTHYENRLTADIGQQIGLNADDVRRAALDEHARARFSKLRPHDANLAAARARELFDLEAFLQALTSELNSFNASSAAESLPRLFLDWASEHISEKHVVFDEDTCTRVEVDCMFVMAVIEMLFLGQVDVLADETYRGHKLRELFGQHQMEAYLDAEEELGENHNTDKDDVSFACKELTNAVEANFTPANCTNNVDDDCILNSSRKDNKRCKKLVTKHSSDRRDSSGEALLSLLGAFSPVSVMSMFGSLFDSLWPSNGTESTINA